MSRIFQCKRDWTIIPEMHLFIKSTVQTVIQHFTGNTVIY